MSCRWDVYCKTCGESHGFDNSNHYERFMWVLIDHAKFIAGLAPLFNDDRTYQEIKLTAYAGYIDPEWFDKHQDHELVAKNEYGEISDKEKCLNGY